MKTEPVPLTEGLAQRVVEMRRDFHRFPELGLTEFRTASAIAARLEALGFDVRAGREVMDERSRVGVPNDEIMRAAFVRAKDEGADPRWLTRFENGFTAVVGTLRGAHSGPVVALRCDIDALPIVEADDASHHPAREGFVSAHRGVMHACGHDVHTAIGLAVAETLAAQRARIHGTIKCIFQPAEEGGRGAVPMRDAGVVDDVASHPPIDFERCLAIEEMSYGWRHVQTPLALLLVLAGVPLIESVRRLKT